MSAFSHRASCDPRAELGQALLELQPGRAFAFFLGAFAFFLGAFALFLGALLVLPGGPAPLARAIVGDLQQRSRAPNAA